jgi:hypothetical protein
MGSPTRIGSRVGKLLFVHWLLIGQLICLVGRSRVLSLVVNGSQRWGHGHWRRQANVVVGSNGRIILNSVLNSLVGWLIISLKGRYRGRFNIGMSFMFGEYRRRGNAERRGLGEGGRRCKAGSRCGKRVRLGTIGDRRSGETLDGCEWVGFNDRR